MKRALVALVACVFATCACNASVPDSAAAVRSELGVASIATLADLTPAEYDQEAAAIRRVGANWIRIVMNWNEIEAIPGSYSWSRIDAAVAAAQRHGLRVLGLLAGPAPAWAGTIPFAQSSIPLSPATYAEFAARTAQRYNSVTSWEIWNEPNIPAYWEPPNASTYATVLRAAYVAIKRVQPRSTVLLGGLSTDPGGMPPGQFVEGVYRSGAGMFFDAVGLHPYTFPYPMDKDPKGRQRSISNVRAVMTAHGQANKKIWITEWGQSTGTGHSAVSAERQADIIMGGLTYLRNQPQIGPIFLFTSRDWSRNPAETELNYGLYLYDYSPKPIVERLSGPEG
jgi:hypothetical protein